MDAKHNMLGNYYRVLEFLYDNQKTTPNGVNFTLMPQSKIASGLNLNRMTVSNLLKEMKEDGFVNVLSSKQYQLTPYAIKVVKTIKKL